jgi:hypothetical protein
MSLSTDQGGRTDACEAFAPPGIAGLAGSLGPEVFLRRAARPSRRAVLHLHSRSGSFVPADLARWYNERGFHFYSADLAVNGKRTLSLSWRRVIHRLQAQLDALDSACRYLREAGGIDGIILSAQGSAAGAVALWCAVRNKDRAVDALILDDPVFAWPWRDRLDIPCPVLVISSGAARAARGEGPPRLGRHVTWLQLSEPGGEPGAAASPADDQRRLFDEMGRWLGAYMYGQVRDQLL